MRKFTLIFILSVAASLQAGPYFINASDSCPTVISVKSHDAKISRIYNITHVDSTMVCTDVCKWQYQYTIDSSELKISSLIDFTFIVKISFSFFDSLNRVFDFSLKNMYPPGKVDSMWGDTESRPGYSKTLYAKITVISASSDHGVYLDSFWLVGNPKLDTNVRLSTTLILSGCYSYCADSAKIPQGKWNWFYMVTSCFQCTPVYSQPTILGHDYSYIFSGDSIYGYQDNSIQFTDTLFNVNICPHTFYTNHTFISPDTSTHTITYFFSYIGDKILYLKRAFEDVGYEQYFLADGTTLESFLPVKNPMQHATIRENGFKVKQLRGDQIQVRYSIARDSKTSLSLYSLSGKFVSMLFNSSQSAGSYELKSKIPLVGKGCYMLVLKKGDVIETAKLNYIR
ncbi:MAG TPA: hypothetical protein VLX68_05755 [Chitinivibrionales bacterium]|nr:hypothetical protein [Chitinivibrionales bacterium]